MYETVLDIAESLGSDKRPLKVFATKNGDFKDYPPLETELNKYDFEIRSRMGALVGDIRNIRRM